MLKPYSAVVPESTRVALVKLKKDRRLRGLNAAVGLVLEHFAGKMAITAVKVYSASTEPHIDAEWNRLSLELPEEIYLEIVAASQKVGITRTRLVGVILVSCQDRFGELVAGTGDGTTKDGGTAHEAEAA